MACGTPSTPKRRFRLRWIGLDVGTKTIGVAISDPLGYTAQGLTTIRRKKTTEDLWRLKDLLAEHTVSGFVVGLPKNMDGSLGPQAEYVQQFVIELEKAFPLPVVLVDERLSTVQAQRSMMDAGMRRDKRKEKIDEQAAMVILQTYLDRLRFQANRDAD